MLSSIYLLSVRTVPDSSSNVNALGFFRMIFMTKAQNICKLFQDSSSNNL